MLYVYIIFLVRPLLNWVAFGETFIRNCLLLLVCLPKIRCSLNFIISVFYAHNSKQSIWNSSWVECKYWLRRRRCLSCNAKMITYFQQIEFGVHVCVCSVHVVHVVLFAQIQKQQTCCTVHCVHVILYCVAFRTILQAWLLI